MRKISLLAGIIAIVITTSAQNIGIGTATPNTTSALEIKSSTKGLLTPGLLPQPCTGIADPAKGLLIYDSTTSSFWLHNGIAWNDLAVAKLLADPDSNTLGKSRTGTTTRN